MRIVLRERVTLHLKSGARLRFTCDDLTKTFAGNELRALSAEHSRGWPFYVRLDDISAVSLRKCWLTGWRVRFS